LFHRSPRVVAGKRHIRIPEDVALDSAVSFGLLGEAEGFGIAMAMTIQLPGIERATPQMSGCIGPIKYVLIPMRPEANIDVLLTVPERSGAMSLPLVGACPFEEQAERSSEPSIIFSPELSVVSLDDGA
jgi:hypothetical protein